MTARYRTGTTCALSFGSGLAAAEQMEHGTNTAFVGVQLGRALGVGAEDLEVRPTSPLALGSPLFLFSPS